MHWDVSSSGGLESPAVVFRAVIDEQNPRKPSWARKQIGLLQLNSQKEALELALLQVELNLRPESGTRALRAREELREQIFFVNEARKVLLRLSTRRKMPWSELTVNLYRWATESRLKAGD